MIGENSASKERIVILLRHGESEWNNENRFCGWVDVGLSETGEKEAIRSAEALKNSGLKISKIFTSILRRAIITVERILKETGLEEARVVRDWRLNERHYGALTGRNKAECVEQYGLEQVNVWRRSYSIRPATMETSHNLYQTIINQTAFRDILTEDQIPRTESLKDLIEERTIPFWMSSVEPLLRSGENVLCVAHGTSLRGIVKHLENLSDQQICKVDIPNGIPIVYRLDENLKMISKQYLADEETVQKAVERVSKILPSK